MSALNQARVVNRQVVHNIARTEQRTYRAYISACGVDLGMDVFEFIPDDDVTTTCKRCLARVGGSAS